MNFYKMTVLVSSIMMLSGLHAMHTIPQFEHQRQARPPQRPSLWSYFIPSSRTVKTGMAMAASYSAYTLLNRHFGQTTLFSVLAPIAQVFGLLQPCLWPQPPCFRLINYAMAGYYGGQYIVDEERNNSRCYALQRPTRYQQLADQIFRFDEDGMPLPPLPDAPEWGWNGAYGGAALAKEYGTDLALSKLVPLAGSIGILQKAGSLMALGAAKSGVMGIATLFGVNLAAVFGIMATKYAIEQLVVNPIIKPVLTRVVNSVSRMGNPQRRPAPILA